MHRLLAALAAAVLLLTVAGCGSSPPAADGSPAQLQFSATTLDGAEFSGQSLLGKPALLWFWAPWCPACQQEAPMVGAAAAAHPAVTFLGVASASGLPAMREFVEKYPVDSFVHLADTDAVVWKKFGVTKQPAFAFLTADGHVDVVKGAISDGDLNQRLAALGGS